MSDVACKREKLEPESLGLTIERSKTLNEDRRPEALATMIQKGVTDAVIAADYGIEAIVISNHGGRQLDSAPATLNLVAPVAGAVGDKTETICDGGVRRGSDIVKALAPGADAVMVGRPYLYELGAAGEAGVDKCCRTMHPRWQEPWRSSGALASANWNPPSGEWVSS